MTYCHSPLDSLPPVGAACGPGQAAVLPAAQFRCHEHHASGDGSRSRRTAARHLARHHSHFLAQRLLHQLGPDQGVRDKVRARCGRSLRLYCVLGHPFSRSKGKNKSLSRLLAVKKSNPCSTAPLTLLQSPPMPPPPPTRTTDGESYQSSKGREEYDLFVHI